MAQKLLTTLVDDVDGSEAEHTIPFSVAGVDYTIDLNDKNAAAFQTVLTPWIEHAQRVGGRKRGGLQVVRGNDVDLAEVRSWAGQNGWDVSNRGRVSRIVLEAYKARKPGPGLKASPVMSVPEPEPEPEPVPVKATPRRRAARKVVVNG